MIGQSTKTAETETITRSQKPLSTTSGSDDKRVLKRRQKSERESFFVLMREQIQHVENKKLYLLKQVATNKMSTSSIANTNAFSLNAHKKQARACSRALLRSSFSFPAFTAKKQNEANRKHDRFDFVRIGNGANKKNVYDLRTFVARTTAKEKSNDTDSNNRSSSAQSSSASFGGSSVLEDFDGQKPEIGQVMMNKQQQRGEQNFQQSPLRTAKNRAEQAMRARRFNTNNNYDTNSDDYRNSGEQRRESNSASSTAAETTSEENFVKKRVEAALEVERVDLRDGSVLFRFSEKPLTRAQKAALAREDERDQISNEDFERKPNFIERWIMTVRFTRATVSTNKAIQFVMLTPIRLLFWSVAYALRLVFWILTGRFNAFSSVFNKGARRATRELASFNEQERQRRMKAERERAFVQGSAKVARDRLNL